MKKSITAGILSVLGSFIVAIGAHGGAQMTNGVASECTYDPATVYYTYPDGLLHDHKDCAFATFPLVPAGPPNSTNPPGVNWVSDGSSNDCGTAVFPPMESHADPNNPDNWGGETVNCGTLGGTAPQTPAE